MIVGSVCSGIGAPEQAWRGLGWRHAFASEIDAFPRAVFAHHFPEIPLHGDFTTIQEGDYDPIDLLVGGTPCQSFSIAGLRGGLADDRGNLALEYLRLADRLRPRWLVWENVPGVLSSHGGRDFGAVIGAMVELGYGVAWRILDAQNFGLAQRRKRVFVVGYLGDGRRAAAVLFERESLSGHPAPCRKTGPGVAALTANGVGTCSADDNQAQAGHLLADATSRLVMRGLRRGELGDVGSPDDAVPDVRVVRAHSDLSHCLNADGMGRQDFESETFIAHSLRGEGFDASEDGTGRGTPLVPVAFALRGRKGGAMPEPHEAVGALRAASGGSTRDYVATSAVRRLTPRECERLQGFPDDYTDVPYRNKRAADGPRYKALGNSMAVPVMRWIGERIAAVDALP